MWHCDRAFGLLFFGQTNALAGIGPGARDATDLRKAADWGGGLELRRIRNDVGHADIGELVFDFTAGTRRDRRRGAAGRRNGEHCDRRRRSDRDSESPRKDQSSSWKVEGRHRHAFCSLLDVSSGKRMDAASDLVAILRFPADASSEVVAGVGICYRKGTRGER